MWFSLLRRQLAYLRFKCNVFSGEAACKSSIACRTSEAYRSSQHWKSPPIVGVVLTANDAGETLDILSRLKAGLRSYPRNARVESIAEERAKPLELPERQLWLRQFTLVKFLY